MATDSWTSTSPASPTSHLLDFPPLLHSIHISDPHPRHPHLRSAATGGDQLGGVRCSLRLPPGLPPDRPVRPRPAGALLQQARPSAGQVQV